MSPREVGGVPSVARADVDVGVEVNHEAVRRGTASVKLARASCVREELQGASMIERREVLDADVCCYFHVIDFAAVKAS